MRRIALLFIALCLSLPALAERKQSFGDLDVHYSAFNSSFLQPEIAAAAGLSRGKQQGVLNISVLKAGQPAAAVVSGPAGRASQSPSNLLILWSGLIAASSCAERR